MKLSVIHSLYNRTELWKRGLERLQRQTLPKEDWELVIVDDNSTEDLTEAFKPYLGKMNIRYIRYDHTKHPIWQEMNPDGAPEGQENWYHTQAISANIGFNEAQGEVICISQPEMLLCDHALEHGYNRASQEHAQIFAEVHWGTDRFNQFLRETPDRAMLSFNELLEVAKNCGQEYEPHHMPPDFFEMYWYCYFAPRDMILAIGGVDLKYQSGVYAEDDQFRARMRMAGIVDKWGGRPTLEGPSEYFIVGIHQSHYDEAGKYKKQNRESQFWNDGASRNRALWANFMGPEGSYTVANENLGYEWGGQFLITENIYHAL